jgi:predicted aspartyl protease
MRILLPCLLLASLACAQQPSDPAAVSAPASNASSARASNDPLVAATAKFNAGHFSEARDAFKAALTECAAAQTCGRAHAGVVRTLLREEKLKEAEEAAATAQAALPADSYVHTAIGELRFRQGRLFDADKEFVAAANAGFPRDARAYLGLARYYRVISMFKRSAEMLEIANRIDPNDPEIRFHWLVTQPASVRLRELARLLSGDNNLDPDERTGLRHALALAEKRAQNPDKRCHLVSKTEAAEAPLEALMDGPNRFYGVGLQVKLNDRKVKLMLDTGASGLLITRKFAEKAGLEILTQAETRGIGDKGFVPIQTANVRSIDIGDLRFENCVVDVIESSRVVDAGLIGPDVLSNYLVSLDFPNHKLRLSPLPKRPEQAQAESSLSSEGASTGGSDAAAGNDKPPVFYDRYVAPEMKDFSGVPRFGSHLLLQTRLNDGAEPKLFLLDTGSTANLISVDAAREITKVRTDDRTRVVGISGSVKKVARADAATLHFGNLRQDVRDLIALDLTPQSHAFGTEISGIIGFSTLRLLKIDIDYRDGLVRFSYNPRPW